MFPSWPRRSNSSIDNQMDKPIYFTQHGNLKAILRIIRNFISIYKGHTDRISMLLK